MSAHSIKKISPKINQVARIVTSSHQAECLSGLGFARSFSAAVASRDPLK